MSGARGAAFRSEAGMVTPIIISRSGSVCRRISGLIPPVLLAALLSLACQTPPDTSHWKPTTTARLWSPRVGAPIPIPAALATLSWLAIPSSWGHSGPPADRAHSGSFGVGNGLVFGLIGLDEPRNTITGAIGPGYQIHAGFFGDTALRLLQEGAPLTPEDEEAQRPRGSAVVRTLAQSGTISWSTTDAAPPGSDFILRHVTVFNNGPAVDGLAVELTLALAPDETPPVMAGALAQVRGTRQLTIECPEATAEASSGSLVLTVPPLAAGAEWSTSCFYLFTTGAPTSVPTGDPVALLTASLAETQAFLAPAAMLTSPDPTVADLYEGMLLTEHIQTVPSGVVSPMSRYTNGWLRDEEGPVRLYTAAGLFEDAKAILDGTYESLTIADGVDNSFPLDLDLTTFAEPADPATFWAQASFLSSLQPVESPSFPPLLYARYVAASGDHSGLTPARLAFLTACVERQVVNEAGLLPFSGDETFRYPLGLVLGSLPESLGWSPNSSFLYAAAAAQVVALGGDPALSATAATVRTAVEAHGWSNAVGAYAPFIAFNTLQADNAPYEDISTQPLWTGYGSPGDPHQQANVAGYLHRLLRPDGTIVSPNAVFYTGMVPAYLLENLSLVGSADAESAFNGIDAVATLSGHFEELHTLDNLPAAVEHNADGLSGDIPARFRPWEGGDVLFSMLDYLIGATPDATAGKLSLAPHLPNGWPAMTASNLRMGPDRYSLAVSGFQEGLVVTLTRTVGTATWQVPLTLSGAKSISQVFVNGKAASIRSGASVVVPALSLPASGTARVIAVYE